MKLSPAQQVWDINSKEAFALVMSIHLHRHLIGVNKLQVVTDNLTTRCLQTLKRSSVHKLLRWALELQGMDIDIKHAPGHTIQAVDALSRIPSQNKTMAKHPNRAELKQPLREELVLNAPPDFQVPSISDLLNETRENEGGDDEVTRQYLCKMRQAQKESDTAVLADSDTDDDSDTELSDNPITFVFPLLATEVALELHEQYLNNLTLMKRKQKQSPDFASMIAYLTSDALPRKKRTHQTLLADCQNFVMGDDGLLYHLFLPSR